MVLLTLDALEMHDEAAQVARRFLEEYGRENVLLELSFCSEKTRAAMANLQAGELLDGLQGRRASFRIPDFAFLAAAGDARTAELLGKAAEISPAPPKKQRDSRWAKYERIARASHRGLGCRRTSGRNARRTNSCSTRRRGTPFANHILRFNFIGTAKKLAANKLSISPAFLIERIDEIEPLPPRVPPKVGDSHITLHSPLFWIVAGQKDDAAIPAIGAPCPAQAGFDRGSEDRLLPTWHSQGERGAESA